MVQKEYPSAVVVMYGRDGDADADVLGFLVC